MQLIHREGLDPFRELEDLSHRVNRLFNISRLTGANDRETLASADWYPSCDISETEDEYRIHAELPNVKREDVRVTIEDSALTIQGERREEKEEKHIKLHRRELSYGSFVRRFTIPADADPKKVVATFSDGMLRVALKKADTKQVSAKEVPVR